VPERDFRLRDAGHACKHQSHSEDSGVKRHFAVAPQTAAPPSLPGPFAAALRLASVNSTPRLQLSVLAGSILSGFHIAPFPSAASVYLIGDSLWFHSS
jgi:hypothetical protein